MPELVPDRKGVEIGDSRAILTGVARVLVNSGHSPTRLAQEMHDICALLSPVGKPFDRRDIEYVAKLPDVLAEWLEDPLYAYQGKPRRLPMRGRAPSMTSLIRAVLPDREPRSIVRALIRMGAIRRHGRFYECISANLVFNGSEAHCRALLVLHAMIRTLAQNLSGQPSALEQSAISARIARRDIPLIHETVRRRGLPLLHNLDAEMRRRARHTKPNEPRTWAGAGMYVIDFPIDTGSPTDSAAGPYTRGARVNGRTSRPKETR